VERREEMNWSLGSCTLLGALSLGIISSVIASALTAAIILLQRKWEDRKIFSKAAGSFLGYSPREDDPRSLSPVPQSQAEIVYEGKNRLRIQVSHDNGTRKWEGLITLENEHHGSLSWEYVDMPPGQCEFGFKRCIISSSGEKVMLIQEPQPKQDGEIRYGREVLIRRS
jgi:hypothetical protein